MTRLKYLITGIFALMLTGCGQTVVEKLQVPAGPNLSGRGNGAGIVILPFADYSGGTIDSTLRRNMVITESLTDRLVAHGFSMPIQEDVFDYLVDEKIITLAELSTANTRSLQVELQNDWSDTMKSELTRYKEQVELEASQRVVRTSGTHGLSTAMVAKLGRHFNADYVVRGRILEYKSRNDPSWEPWKKGVLPFVNGISNRVLNGFAASDEYDERNESITGMLLAGVAGYNSADNDSDTQAANAIVWGALGYGSGSIAHTSGKVDQAVVQLRIWVQEATTGHVVWTNRIRVQVSPATFFADNQYDTLFNSAIEKGVSTLMENFITYGI